MKTVAMGILVFRSYRERLSLQCRIGLVTSLGILILLAIVSSSASAQTLTTLASFNDTNGSGPTCDLTLVGSTLYGTTYYGGTNHVGTVFSVPISGGTPTVLATFNNTNGANPAARLTVSLDGSTLYGTTQNGGAYGYGTVFSVPVNGGTPTVLASLANHSNPTSSLTLSGPNLYGTTYGGGTQGHGAVFSVPVTGGNPTFLASFNNTNGYSPMAGLTLVGSTLYGTTYAGGASQGGVVFSIPISGGGFTTLASFSPATGMGPMAGVTLSGSTFYGTTPYEGPSQYGTVYSVPIGGGNPTVLAAFDSIAYPRGIVAISGSTLYGTTSRGGDYGYGTIFSIPITGGKPTTLLSFNGSNGKSPHSGLTLIGSTLYGTTAEGGGTNQFGTVFALNIAPASIGLSSVSNATIISGGSATLAASVSNSPNSGYNLNYTLTAAIQNGNGTLGAPTSATGHLTPGASQSCTVSATSTNLGIHTILFTASDPDASNSPQTVSATLTVLDHAAAAFADGTSSLNLDFGTLQAGTGTYSLKYQIQNLLADYRAKLDLDSLTEITDGGGVFSTNAAPFSNLPNGDLSSFFDMFLDTAAPGRFTGQYEFNLSDEKGLDGHAGFQVLTLNVTANVVPEPSTIALLGMGTIGLLGWAWRRKRVSP